MGYTQYLVLPVSYEQFYQQYVENYFFELHQSRIFNTILPFAYVENFM